jgi:hypothetical protein
MIDQGNTLLIYLIYWISDLGTSMVITTYLPIMVEPHVSMAVLRFYL